MGQAIVVRTDYSSGEVRRLAQRAKAAGQARRLLAIAAVLDGYHAPSKHVNARRRDHRLETTSAGRCSGATHP